MRMTDIAKYVLIRLPSKKKRKQKVAKQSLVFAIREKQRNMINFKDKLGAQMIRLREQCVFNLFAIS